MIIVTNAKVQGYKPVWAPFKGFSLLFDNPGDGYADLDSSSRLEKIHASKGCSIPAFYRAISKHFSSRESKWVNSFYFCPLPPESYHVTVWDGINEGNWNKVLKAKRFDAEDLVHGFPDTMLSDSPFFSTADGRSVDIRVEETIRFAFDRLNVSPSVAVLTLKPADPSSEQLLNHIVDQRNRLIADFQSRFGLLTTGEKYRPHVSLGYFANKEYAALAAYEGKALDESLRTALDGITLDFASISVYGFSDMATYYRIKA